MQPRFESTSLCFDLGVDFATNTKGHLSRIFKITRILDYENSFLIIATVVVPLEYIRAIHAEYHALT